MTTIGMIGSHSAEEIAMCAKSNGFETLVFCQKGRERLYTHYNKHLFDEIIVLESFKDILLTENTDRLIDKETIIFPNRSLSAYLGYDRIESWNVKIYGNKKLQRIEDRDYHKNQYWLMKQAGIRYPEQFSHDDIPKLAIVKVQQKHNKMERAFFYVTSPEDLETKADQLIISDLISEQEFRKAVIEEFVLGPRFNANFHAFALEDHFAPGFEFVGFDDRVQANLQGILNLPAKDQLKLSVNLTNEEIGHRPLTMRESKKPKVYDMAEKFLKGVKANFPPKMIGMFALQGAFTDKNEFVIFDISPRVPGAPIIGTTSPEIRRLSLKYGTLHSPLDLSMIEIKYADQYDMIDKITT